MCRRFQIGPLLALGRYTTVTQHRSVVGAVWSCLQIDVDGFLET